MEHAEKEILQPKKVHLVRAPTIDKRPSSSVSSLQKSRSTLSAFAFREFFKVHLKMASVFHPRATQSINAGKAESDPSTRRVSSAGGKAWPSLLIQDFSLLARWRRDYGGAEERMHQAQERGRLAPLYLSLWKRIVTWSTGTITTITSNSFTVLIII